jgi:hypothetical protein
MTITPPKPLEFVFKRVGQLEIVLDVYLPPEATAQEPASVCVWWHGGGCESRVGDVGLSIWRRRLMLNFFD